MAAELIDTRKKPIIVVLLNICAAASPAQRSLCLLRAVFNTECNWSSAERNQLLSAQP